jgi:hypothetical protein
LKRLKQWEAADVILMGVGQDGGSHLDFLQILQHRRRIVADMLGVHATIEKHGSLGKVQPVAVRADARSTGQIGKTHKKSA